MKTFTLPDLGEGLPDAQIREWYVKVGDNVKTDQPLVAMETAKALVDVPAPFDGTIEKLFGQPGDIIDTGQPLIGFVGAATTTPPPKDSGTVVGTLEEGDMMEDTPAVGVTTNTSTTQRVKATPAVRMLAKQLGVDLATLTPTGANITAADVKRAASQPLQNHNMEGEWTTLSGVRRAMVISMAQAQQEVVPVTIVDDADIHAWSKKEDISVRLIRAIQVACEAVPLLNAYFDGKTPAYQQNKHINLGIAVDTPHGLYVPVIKNVAQLDDATLRAQIDRFKQQAHDHNIAQEDLHGATIMLSNYGAFAGRYATPIMVPPLVAIVGVGRSREAVVPANGQPAIHRVLPLAVTTDHRLVSGGEMARFLQVMIKTLAA